MVVATNGAGRGLVVVEDVGVSVGGKGVDWVGVVAVVVVLAASGAVCHSKFGRGAGGERAIGERQRI